MFGRKKKEEFSSTIPMNPSISPAQVDDLPVERPINQVNQRPVQRKQQEYDNYNDSEYEDELESEEVPEEEYEEREVQKQKPKQTNQNRNESVNNGTQRITVNEILINHEQRIIDISNRLSSIEAALYRLRSL